MLSVVLAMAASFSLVSRTGPDTFVDAAGTSIDARVVHETASGPLERAGRPAFTIGASESGSSFSRGLAIVTDARARSRVVDRNGAVRFRVPSAFRLVDASTPSAARDADAMAHEATHDPPADPRPQFRLEDRSRFRTAADVDHEGIVTNAPDLWSKAPAWPAELGVPPRALVVPDDDEYLALRNAALIIEDAAECRAAAAEMLALAKGADPEAWLATERCARIRNDEPAAAIAHAAFLVSAGLDPAVRRARTAWAALARDAGSDRRRLPR